MYTLDICFEDITREVKKNHKVTNKGLIKSAYDYATKKHKDQKPRKTGEPYIMHPLRVAYLVASWGFEADTICAALLHDTLEDTDATYDELVTLFGKKVTDMVDAVTAIDNEIKDKTDLTKEEIDELSDRRLKEKMESLMDRNMISRDSKIMFVNDGSKDRTWEMIEELHDQDPLYQGVKLSRNRGHQNALLGGLMTAKEYADMVISLDADLQDDIDVIDQFVEKYYEGCDIVYGVRSARTTDTFFKRFTAEGFYKIINLMGGEVVFNHADYRLMSKRALEEMAKYKEVNLFLRGIVPMIGFKTDVVTYERHERMAGESKYPLKKMLALAVDGITSLSIKPIRFIVFLGFMIFMCSILMLIYSLVQHFLGNTSIGWTSLIVSIWAIGGLQLLAIGVIGEYIGKIYLETKERPRYIIEKVLR